MLRATLMGAALAALLAPAPALAHGGPVAPSELPWAWRPEPLVLVYALVALALFARAFVRLRRRGRTDHASVGRALLFAGGLAVVLVALVSPLDAVGEQYLVSGHMLQHVLEADVAAALLLAAVRGPLVFLLLPGFALRPLARSPLRALARLLLRPRVSFAAWVAVFGAWHIPIAYNAALRNQSVHDLQHLSFLVAGLLVWAQLVDPARRRRLTFGGRLGFAAALFAAGTVLSDVLIFSFRPLYGFYVEQPVRLFGLSPLRDQQLAGLVMMVEQLVVLGTFALLLLRARARSARDGRLARPPARAVVATGGGARR